MSAPYKVMEQMQKTRPRRLRGNREVMIVMGAIIVVGILLLVNSLNKRLKADNLRARQVPTAEVNVGAPDDGASMLIPVSLNEQRQWVVEGHGVVTSEDLPEVLAAKRAEANQQGVRAIVMAHIEGDQPAKYFMELHRVAEDCQLDEVRIEAQGALLEEDG